MLRESTLWMLLLLAAPPPVAVACGDSAPRRYEPRTFLGYACEDGCERHKAGFRWAERRVVKDARRCATLPEAESEGCLAFLDEHRRAEAAGERWAIENEIAHPRDCSGAGERFLVGCVRQLLQPTRP